MKLSRRTLLNVAVLTALWTTVFAGCREALWLLDSVPMEDPVVSLDGRYIAQVRSLPEGSELPYAAGVYVRRANVPLWSTSDLIFAAYCAPVSRLVWTTAELLSIGCDVAEGHVLKFESPTGVTVVHNGRRGPLGQSTAP